MEDVQNVANANIFVSSCFDQWASLQNTIEIWYVHLICYSITFRFRVFRIIKLHWKNMLITNQSNLCSEELKMSEKMLAEKSKSAVCTVVKETFILHYLSWGLSEKIIDLGSDVRQRFRIRKISRPRLYWSKYLGRAPVYKNSSVIDKMIFLNKKVFLQLN